MTFFAHASQAATMALGDASAIPAQTQVALPLSLTVAAGEQVTALTVDIYFDSSITQWQSVALDPTVSALGKQVATNTIASGHVRVIIYGTDRQVFASGTIGQCLMNVAASAPSGTTVISLQSGLGSDPNGNDLPLILSDGRLWIDAVPDTVPPQLSAISVASVTQTAATVTWTTDELSTSQVDYGLTTAYGATTPLDSTMTLAHSVALSGLTAGTTYHVRVRSVDARGNEAVSGDVAFATLPPPTVAAPTLTPSSGTFSGSVSVAIVSATTGASIRYTTDGSDPGAGSALYSQPVVLTGSATLKARAYQSGMTDSAITTGTFTITSATGTELTAAQSSASSAGWSLAGTDKVAWNAGEWLEYPVDFGAGGSWTLRLTATNQTTPSAPGLPSGYAFNIAISVDGVSRGSLSVPGSTTTYQTGSTILTMPSGIHTVRFVWTNDYWVSGQYDANIRVRSVFFAAGTTASTTSATTGQGFTAAQATPISSGWITSGTDRYSWNANQWLEYQSVDFGTGGTWAVSLTAMNQKNPKAPGLPPGYAFLITLSVDGVSRGTIQVPGSTTTYQTGTINVTMPSGRHTVRFLWTNDYWVSGQYDANIRVRSVNLRVVQ